MDQKTYALNLARRFDVWKTGEGLMVFAAFIASWFALSTAVFMRRDFGERYLGWINLAFAYTAVVNFAFLGNLINGFLGRGTSQLIFLVWMAFIAASGYHRYVIWKKNRAGVQWHSHYAGTSLLMMIPVSEEAKLLWVEPGIVMVLSILLAHFAPLVSTWLYLSAISLWVHAQITVYYQRQAVLDAVDAGLEARYLGEAVAGKPARETAGVTIAESVRQLVRNDPGVVALMGGLAPELRDMIKRGE